MKGRCPTFKKADSELPLGDNEMGISLTAIDKAIDVKQMLTETEQAIAMLIQAHQAVPDEAMQMLGMLRRCVVAEYREQELVSAVTSLISVIDTPSPNCSCHISPPCGDCVEYAGLREAVAEGKAALIAMPQG